MKKRILSLSFTLIAIILISGPMLCEDLVIIANSSVPETRLTRQKLQDIFLGDILNWSNGDKIILATLKNGETNDEFLKNIISRSSSQYNTYWRQIVFTGKGTPPQVFESENELIDFVASTKGAIGYTATQPENEDIKIIKIE